jgi:hypothetical protein
MRSSSPRALSEYAPAKSRLSIRLIESRIIAAHEGDIQFRLRALQFRRVNMKTWLSLGMAFAFLWCSLTAAAQEKKLDYEIIKSSKVPGIRCSLDVRINRKATESEIGQLARRIRNAEPGNYERFYICYYLHGMQVGAGAWATSHFDPGLRVAIQGLRQDEEQKLIQTADTTKGELIGTWVYESAVANTTSLIRQDNKVIMLVQFKDGSKSLREMTETRLSSGTKYEEKGGNRFGEYYILGENRLLKLLDRDGLISILRPVWKEGS